MVKTRGFKHSIFQKGDLLLKIEGDKMKAEDAKIGMEVRSKVNDIYRGTYRIIWKNKVTCWVETGKKKNGKSHCYRNVRYSILEPA